MPSRTPVASVASADAGKKFARMARLKIPGKQP